MKTKRRILLAIPLVALAACSLCAQGITIGSGTTFSLGGATLSLPNNWSNSGTFVPGTGTVVFAGASGTQTIANASGEIFGSLTLDKASGDLQLLNNCAVNGSLTLTKGDLDIHALVLTLGSSAVLSESAGNTLKGGIAVCTKILNAPSSTPMIGALITSSANLGSTTVARGHALQSIGGGSSIARYFDIAPATNTALNATLVLSYDHSELGGLTESQLVPLRSTDGGTSWQQVAGTLDMSSNTVTITGVNSFSRWTLGTGSMAGTSLQVDARPAMQWGRFNPQRDSLVVRGDMAPLTWTTSDFRLTDEENDSLYTITVPFAVTGTLQYKFVVKHDGFDFWEFGQGSGGNRTYAIISGGLTLPVASFDSLPAYQGLAGEYKPDANTVALWHFNEDATSHLIFVNGSQVLFDQSGGGNHAYASNTTTATGKYGAGRKLSTPTGDINVVNSPLFDVGAGDFTIEAWIQTTSTAYSDIFILGGGGAGRHVIELSLSNGALSSYVATSSNTPAAEVVVPLSSVKINDGSWHQVAGIRQGSTFTTYIDGEVAGTITKPGIGDPWALSEAIHIGRTPGGAVFNGLIDEVRLSKVARQSAPPPVIPPPSSWMFASSTGRNATIGIPTSINPTIGTRLLQTGDAVGVFFVRNDSLVCAGYSLWQNGKSMAITAWGDNDQTTRFKEGFTERELIRYKVWDAQAGKELNAIVQYQAGGTTYASDGVYVLSSLVALRNVAHVIQLSQGWNMISSFVVPKDSTLDSIFVKIKSDMLVAKNGAGLVYWPLQSINTIGKWSFQDGYLMYMLAKDSVTISGDEIDPQQVPLILPKGWNLVSYLRNSPMRCDSALASIAGSLAIMKNGSGQVYWPEWSINQIGTMRPGAGYQMFLSSEGTLTYPANLGPAPSTTITSAKVGVIAALAKSVGEEEAQSMEHYAVTMKETGSNVILSVEGKGVSDGDEIGVWAEGGLLVGSGIVVQGRAVVTVWGDDRTTEKVKEGAADGENLTLKVWQKTAQKEKLLTIGSVTDGLTAKKVEGGLKYATDGVWIVEVTEAREIPVVFSLEQNYPNPFNPSTTIQYGLPKDAKVTLAIYNLLGQKVTTLVDGEQKAGYYQVLFQANNLSSGVYFYIISAESFRASKKLMLIK